MALAGGGCVTEQHSEFRGRVTWGGQSSGVTETNPIPVQEIGVYFQTLDPAYTNAMTGYGWADGNLLVVIRDRQNFMDHGLQSNMVQAVYFTEPRTAVSSWFLGISDERRDQAPGIHHLYGTFAIERWKDDLDFRIRVKMQSTGTNPVVIDGIVTDYESVQFNPRRWTGMLLGAMGVGPE